MRYTREQVMQELAGYYGCPDRLLDEAADYVMQGLDPAEVVEALLEAEAAAG